MCGLQLRGEKMRSQKFYLTIETYFKPRPTKDLTNFSQRMMKPTFSSLLEDFTNNYNGCTNFSQYNIKASYINSHSSVQKIQDASKFPYLVFGYNCFVTTQKTEGFKSWVFGEILIKLCCWYPLWTPWINSQWNKFWFNYSTKDKLSCRCASRIDDTQLHMPHLNQGSITLLCLNGLMLYFVIQSLKECPYFKLHLIKKISQSVFNFWMHSYIPFQPHLEDQDHNKWIWKLFLHLWPRAVDFKSDLEFIEVMVDSPKL